MALKERMTKASPGPGSMAIFWLGQSSFAFKSLKGTLVYVDPYLSETGREMRRIAPIPIPPEELEGDMVLFTHSDLDHLDENTVPGIVKGCAKTMFGGSRKCLAKAERLGIIPPERMTYIEVGESIECADFKIHAVYAEHGGGPQGYVLDCGGPITYITGDSLLRPQMEAVKRFWPNIFMACINGAGGNMNVHEAAYLAKVLRPQLAIPMHYGMFNTSTVDPQGFIEALRVQEAGVPAFLCEVGGGYIFDRQANLLARI